MIYHVLPGDAIAEEFKKAGLPGEVIVCREALVTGPIDATAPDEFWARRGQFVLSEYGEDEIDFQERVADELEKLSSVGSNDEVNLWFEYELFCSVNMWFCLYRLSETVTSIYRVEPALVSESERWDGFGRLNFKELIECHMARQLFVAGDIALGTQLWAAYCRRDAEEIRRLGDSDSARFPYLKEIAEAAAEIETRPGAVLDTIRSEGFSDPTDIVREFTKRAGVYGLGDLQIKRLIETGKI